MHERSHRGRIGLILAALALGGLAHGFLPLGSLPEGTEPERVRVGLAILFVIGTLWLSEALPLAITALGVPLLAILTGLLDVRAAFASFAHPLIFLFLAGFGLAAALSAQGLDRWLADQVVRRFRGDFRRSAFGLFGVSAVLSMWVSNTATVALLLPVALGLLADVQQGSGERAATRAAPFLLLGIAYAASIGGIGTVIGSPPNAIAAAALGLSFADWLRLALPFVVLLLPALFFLLVKLAPPGTIAPLDTAASGSFSFDGPRVATLGVFSLAILGWLASRPLSGAFGIGAHFDTVVAIAALVALVALGLVRWREIDQTVDWSVLLLFGGGLTLSVVLSESGASRALAAQLSASTAGLPFFLLVASAVLFLVFLTEVSSNTATAALFVPLLLATAHELGEAPTALVVPAAIACSCAFMLPVATPPNAIVFGSGRIEQREMMRVGVVLNAVCIALIAALAWLVL
jgi:sodium-dependent dicarboxylate transporter 2/3/5